MFFFQFPEIESGPHHVSGMERFCENSQQICNVTIFATGCVLSV